MPRRNTDPADLKRRRAAYRAEAIAEHKKHLLDLDCGWTEAQSEFTADRTFSAAFVRTIIRR